MRQARLILALLRRHLPAVSAIADYGAGRGFFLAACKEAGVTPLAGLDTSPLAVESLRASGIEAHLISADEHPEPALGRLTFRPKVVTLLDVVEHFPPLEMGARVRSAVAGVGSALELLVVKVPVPGLLYAGSGLSSRLGSHGPLRQLYQAGTWPPHFNFFSTASLGRFLADCGLRVVEAVGERDFDVEALPDRVGARLHTSRAVLRLGGRPLAAVVESTGWFDSMIVLARPIRSTPVTP
jgi:hypothetical protein